MLRRALILSALLFAAAALLLAGCAEPGSVYVGFLDEHDQEIFRAALAREDIPEASEEALVEPWTWIVVYGPRGSDGGLTMPIVLGHNAIVLAKYPLLTGEIPCPRDMRFLAVARHEIGHTKGKLHSSDSRKVMHDPTPCWPTD